MRFCDCCKKLKPDGELEEVEILIKKCKDDKCTVPESILLPYMQVTAPVNGIAHHQAEPMRVPVKRPPAGLKEAFQGEHNL